VEVVKTKVLGTRVTEATYWEVMKICNAENRTPGEVVRDALKLYLATYKRDTKSSAGPEEPEPEEPEPKPSAKKTTKKRKEETSGGWWF